MRRANAELAEDLDRGEERAGLTVEAEVHFGRGRHGRRQLRLGKAEATPTVTERVPRIARTLAMAIEMQRLVDEGVVADYAELARIAGLTRARVSQVLALTNLAPDLAEAVLELRPAETPPTERELRRIVSQSTWGAQRRSWTRLRDQRPLAIAPSQGT